MKPLPAVTLAPLTLPVALQALSWRAAARATLRTSALLTEEQQRAWWHGLQDRTSPHRYWEILEQVLVAPETDYAGFVTRLIGMGGLTFISWGNRTAEIALILDPSYAGKGYGTAAVDAILEEAFLRMGLETVIGEVYHSSGPTVAFWMRQMERHSSWRLYAPAEWGAPVAVLPKRKFWDGRFWDATWFQFDREAWQVRRAERMETP